MPILKKEKDVFPDDLLERMELFDSAWLFSVINRREKDFMRRLLKQQVAFYGPMLEKRYRSPNGRFRTSYSPLFPNYVFVFGNEEHRHAALRTNCSTKHVEISDVTLLSRDLSQIQKVLHSGVAITPEDRLEPGDPVFVKNGPFKGFEGQVIRRENQTRLLVFVHFIEQGVSMEIDQSQLRLL